MTRQTSSLGLFGALLLASLSTGCGGAAQNEPSAPGAGRDDERATALLQKARETKDIERYHRLVSRFGDTKAAEEGRDELAGLLVAEAKKSLKDSDFSTADERAEEATLYAGLENTRAARDVQKQVDEARASKVAKKADAAAGEGKCASALKLVADPLRSKPRANFKRELLKQSETGLLGCLTRKIGEEVKAGNIDAARSLVTSPDATTALSKEAWGKANDALKKVLVEQSLGAVKPLLESKKWTEAFAKLDELKKAGKLSDEELPVARDVVKDAIQKHVLELSKTGAASKKPGEVAKAIEDEIKLAGWEHPPDEVARAQYTLAVAVECERLHCKLGKPTPAWAWGALTIHPASASAASEEAGKLAHAQKAWVLGRGGNQVLVVTEDPGAVEGPALFEKATGWVEAKNLKPADTALWLPPTEQLKGVLVWAPLRAPAKDYHLGTVKKVEGRKATVERMQDKAEIVVDLAALRVGTLSKGTRVMAFCADQVHTEPAKIESVVASEGGVPKLKYICDKGDIDRVDIASALVSKAEWLPPKKP